jgi:hypothetical protein
MLFVRGTAAEQRAAGYRSVWFILVNARLRARPPIKIAALGAWVVDYCS